MKLKNYNKKCVKNKCWSFSLSFLCFQIKLNIWSSCCRHKVEKFKKEKVTRQMIFKSSNHFVLRTLKRIFVPNLMSINYRLSQWMKQVKRLENRPFLRLNVDKHLLTHVSRKQLKIQVSSYLLKAFPTTFLKDWYRTFSSHHTQLKRKQIAMDRCLNLSCCWTKYHTHHMSIF